MAHEAAQKLIYPVMFNIDPSHLRFESTLLQSGAVGQVLDGMLAIDRIIRVQPAMGGNNCRLRGWLQFTIQERFRELRYYEEKHYRDITITEWNNESDLPSELYKLAADYFVYGLFGPPDRFKRVIAIDVTKFKREICQGNVKYEFDRNLKNQRFISSLYTHLEELDVVVYSQKDQGNQLGGLL